MRGCDAIYIALAEQLSETLVTLDKQQNERGQAVVQTVQPQSARGATHPMVVHTRSAAGVELKDYLLFVFNNRAAVA